MVCSEETNLPPTFYRSILTESKEAITYKSTIIVNNVQKVLEEDSDIPTSIENA